LAQFPVEIDYYFSDIGTEASSPLSLPFFLVDGQVHLQFVVETDQGTVVSKQRIAACAHLFGGMADVIYTIFGMPGDEPQCLAQLRYETSTIQLDRVSAEDSTFQSCPMGGLGWVQLALPGCILATGMGLYLLSEIRKAQRSDVSRLGQLPIADTTTAAELARCIGCFFALVDHILFSMIIPDSFDLSSSIGGDAMFSGTIIGAFKLGTALGAMMLFVCLKAWPELWRTSARSIYFSCVSCNILGLSSYLVVAAIGSNRFPIQGAGALRWARFALFAGRMVTGGGAGFRLMLLRTHVARLTEAPERPMQMARVNMAVMLGIALGPLFAAASGVLDLCKVGGAQPRFEIVGILGLALCLCEFGAALCLPRLDDCTDFLASDHAAESSATIPDAEVQRRRIIIWSGLSVSMLRGFCLSMVESGTAFLLQTRFQWSSRFTGLAIGASFLTVIPLKEYYNKCHANSKTSDWIRGLMLCSLCGSIALFSYGLNNSRLEAGMLLLGDALLFPSFFMSDGLVQGLITQNLLPADISILNLSSIIVFNTLSLDGLARFVGPPVARLYVVRTGQNGYAFQQFCIVAVSVIIFEVCMRPRLLEGTTTTESTREDSSNLRWSRKLAG